RNPKHEIRNKHQSRKPESLGFGDSALFRISGFGFRISDLRVKGGPAMLTVLGSPRRCCDGLTRRETLKAGALGLMGGLTLPQLLAAQEARPNHRAGRANNVIFLYLLGGTATQDMIALKPD